MIPDADALMVPRDAALDSGWHLGALLEILITLLSAEVHTYPSESRGNHVYTPGQEKRLIPACTQGSADHRDCNPWVDLTLRLNPLGT